MFVAAIAAFGLVQQQFFPTSTRTELFFEMRLPEGTAIGVTDAAAQEGRAPARRRPRHRDLHELCGPGRAALLARAQSGAAERRTSRRSSSSPRTSRRASASRRGSNRRSPTARCRRRAPASTVSSSARRSAIPVQFRVIGPDPLKVREIAEQVRQVMAANPQDHRPASRLERAGQVDPPRGRPGPRPRARPHPAGRGADAADAAHRA